MVAPDPIALSPWADRPEVWPVFLDPARVVVVVERQVPHEEIVRLFEVDPLLLQWLQSRSVEPLSYDDVRGHGPCTDIPIARHDPGCSTKECALPDSPDGGESVRLADGDAESICTPGGR